MPAKLPEVDDSLRLLRRVGPPEDELIAAVVHADDPVGRGVSPADELSAAVFDAEGIAEDEHLQVRLAVADEQARRSAAFKPGE